MKKTVLREYAKLIVRTGLNVQKGQEVVVYADLDQPEFVQMVVEECYKAKAKTVRVEWRYQPLPQRKSTQSPFGIISIGIMSLTYLILMFFINL